MSGIVGYINNSGKTSSNLLESMSESIRYTESSGIDKWNDDFAAISRVHHAITNPELQPIFNEDKSICIVMCGEVFDYKEQKLKLIHNGHRFKFENNDAEYCLHLYEEEGLNAFKELNGSFCLVIYNIDNHELLLVNDRFSSQPLFYHLTDKKTFLFGTQLSSILQSSEVPRELNMGAIFEFFTFLQVWGTKTFYKDIKLLPPATVLHYQDGNISFEPYWEMKYKEEKHPEGYYVDELATAIKKAVERRMRGNYRFGLLLSGGLDSRMILAASDKQIVCFTFGDFKNREVNIAKRIANVKGCKHIFLKRDRDHYVNLMEDAVEIGGGMYGFVHAHAIGFFDEICKHCDILMDGFAIERLFRGTNLPHRSFNFLRKNFFTVLDKISNENLPHKIINKCKDSLYPMNPHQLFVKSYSALLDDVLLDSVKNTIKEAEISCTNIYDKFIWSDTHYLSISRAFLFETSIRSFINERSIVFDNNLFDLHLKMPVSLRANNRLWKKVLAQLNPKIAVCPDANTGYSPFMPKIFEKGIRFIKGIASKLHLLRSCPLPHPTYTQRSWPNWFELIRHNEKLKDMMSSTLSDPQCLDPNIFDIQRVKEMFQECLNGKYEFTVFLFLLLTFGQWHKKHP